MTRLAVAACLLVALAAVPSAVADVEVSDQPYVRHDGGTDATIGDCSSDATTPTAGGDGSGERQQNEPSAAVDPLGSGHMVAGANDYCSFQTTTDAWAGFYYSANRGASWTNSLLPGYPTDTSPEGQASPLHRFATAAGDPVQAWDDERHVYFGGIAFNRARPASGSIWVARYSWPLVATAPDYEYTTLVSRGTPSPLFVGHFEDKVQLEVDKGIDSPYNGSIYLCWARFTGSARNNAVYFARSDDGARTFRVQKIAESVHGSQFCDIAVTRNGTIFVAWRQFAFKPEQGQRQDNAVAWAKSTDGGKSFSKPAIAAEFIGWDLTDLFGSPQAAGEALYQACLAGDYTPGGCSGPEPREPAQSCGDGPLRCQSGYVFFRANTQVRIAADPTASGDPDAAYVVFDASVPGSLTQTGTTFGTVGSGTGSQASVHFIKTENGGATWSAPARIDSQAVGHQFFPDIDADGGVLHAVWQDSRNDCAVGPAGTAGDFRTVPIANMAVATNPPGGVNCEPGGAGSDTGGVVAVYATSANGGTSWPTSIVSSALTMPQYEQFGNRDTPFFGDYNYIDAAAGDVLMAWTDERETVPGTDPRYTDGDGNDGFDVIQCRPAGNPFGADLCPNAGGLDQSIFGAVFP